MRAAQLSVFCHLTLMPLKGNANITQFPSKIYKYILVGSKEPVMDDSVLLLNPCCFMYWLMEFLVQITIIFWLEL